MASATNIKELEFGGTYQSVPLGKAGQKRWRYSATLPSGQVSCTIAGIPQLRKTTTYIHVQQAAGGLSAGGLIEVSASRTEGENHGTITISTCNGSTASGDINFLVDGQNL